MAIFEKIDMQRHRRDINLCKPVSQPDATGFSGAGPDEIEAKPSASLSGHSAEHSTPVKSIPIVKSIRKLTIFKSKKAQFSIE